MVIWISLKMAERSEAKNANISFRHLNRQNYAKIFFRLTSNFLKKLQLKFWVCKFWRAIKLSFKSRIQALPGKHLTRWQIKQAPAANVSKRECFLNENISDAESCCWLQILRTVNISISFIDDSATRIWKIATIYIRELSKH